MKFRHFIAAAVIGMVIIGAVAITAAYRGAHQWSPEELNLTSPDLPKELEGLRIVFAADIHTGRWRNRVETDKIMADINAVGADLIILGGDYVGGRSEGWRDFYSAAAALEAPLGVYAVAGNHDYWEDKENLSEYAQSANLTLLRNESVKLEYNGAEFYLSAIDDDHTGHADTAATFANVPTGVFDICVTHAPDIFAKGLVFANADGNKVRPNLALAGHTHGGQVTIFGQYLSIPSKYGNRYLGGWRKEDGVPIFITNGLGVSAAPLRFGAPAHFEIITFHKEP